MRRGPITRLRARGYSLANKLIKTVGEWEVVWMLVVAETSMSEARPRARDDLWLCRELRYLWSVFFRDVPHANTVEITFAGYWKTRVGLITLSLNGRKSLIKINGYLRLPEVPDYVVTATIAHELVHYSHGFGSPLAQRYPYPHRGGIVTRELIRRGLGFEHNWSGKWLKENWFNLLARTEGNGSLSGYRLSAATINQEIGYGAKLVDAVTSEPVAIKEVDG